MNWIQKDRDWKDYPVGTLAKAIMGGHWYKTERGWKWNGPSGSGGVFPTPGGDASGMVSVPVKLNCMVCGTEFEGQEPQMCCSGRDCGCMGLPTEPVICSPECYYNLPHQKHLTDEERARLISEANEQLKQE